MKKIGLFFGSFNPVHTGHMIIAEFMATQTDLAEVWMVVSPQNPLKNKSTLAPDYERLHMLYLAVGDNNKLRPVDIEFSMPKPSFTIDTLTYLGEKYPDKKFVLIMGGDNLSTLHKWKNYKLLLENYEIYLYNRPDHDVSELTVKWNIKSFNSPQMAISATYIRECLKERQSVKYLVPLSVEKYLVENMIYE